MLEKKGTEDLDKKYDIKMILDDLRPIVFSNYRRLLNPYKNQRLKTKSYRGAEGSLAFGSKVPSFDPW